MDLQVQQHHTFQRREWRWVRLGWAAMAALIAAGLLALLGPGPASWISTKRAGGLVTVDYQRFAHHGISIVPYDPKPPTTKEINGAAHATPD